MTDYSKNINISQGNISLRTDQDDSSISLEKLKTWNPQNFTSLLNNPNPQYSFYEDLKNKIYSGIYETNSNYDLTDYSKDFEKFTDISSPRSQSSSSKSTKLSFKDLLNESYDDYLNKIKKEYIVYKSNHHSRRSFNNNSFNLTDESRVLTTESNSKQAINDDVNINIYQSSQKIYKIIPKEFFTNLNINQFKLNQIILDKKREDIEKYCRELIEKCGNLEFEIDRILQHSSKLYNFITNNLQPLCDDLEFTTQKFKSMREAKNLLKQKVLMNSSKSIQLGQKRQNLCNMITTIRNIKYLKEICDLLKVLANNPSKFQVTQDLINKGKQLISQINSIGQNNATNNNVKKHTNNSSIKLIKLFEDEIAKTSNKSLEKIQLEFSNVLIEEINKMIMINEEKMLKKEEMTNEQILYFSKIYNFNLSSELKNGNSPGIKILSCISYQGDKGSLVDKESLTLKDELYSISNFKDNKKFREILQTLFKLDQEFFSKLRKILTQNYFDYIGGIKETISNLVYKKTSMGTNSIIIDKLEIVSVQDTDKLDLLFLMILNKIFNQMEMNLQAFTDFLNSELDFYFNSSQVDEKKREIIKNNYNDEMNEIIKITKNEILKVQFSTVGKILTNALHYSNLNLFFENYFTIFNLCSSYINLNANMNNLYCKIQNESISLYFEAKDKKMRESVDCEDWTAVKIVPQSHQNIINFISKFDISKLKEIEPLKILKLFEENETLLPTNEIKVNSGEENFIATVEILNINNNVVSFKLILTTLDIIKVVYDSLKLISLFDKSLLPTIISNLSKYLNNFVLLMKEFVLDGEGFRKGRLKRLSQQEVSIVSSNACIIRNIIQCLIKNNEEHFTKNNFEDLMINLDKIRHTCRYNMSDMLDNSIKESMSELYKLDLSNYPVVSDEDKRPFNEFVKRYHKINSAYASMINAYEDVDIIITLQENLKVFFDKLEMGLKSLSEKQKMTDPNQQKQFKRDMTAIKKNLKTYKILGNVLEQFQEKVDAITKIVLPKATSRKRQITEEK